MRGAWLVLLIALVPRLLFVALAPMPRVQSDPSGYDAAARRLIVAGSFAFPVGRALWAEDVFREDAWHAYLAMPANAWSMPGYTVLLATVYRLSGTGPGRLAAVRIVQAVMGAITVVLLFRIAGTLLGTRAAWIATILAALYPPSVALTGYLLTEIPFTLLLVAQVAAMVWAARTRRFGAYGLLGALTAAAVYLRPVAAFVPLLLLGFEAHRWIRELAARRAPGRQILRFAACAAATVALLAPWWIRNLKVYGAFLPTTSAMALPAIQGELMVQGLAVPDETYAQFALPALTGNNDHAYAEKVARQILRVSPLAAHHELATGQIGRARMLGRALISPFTFLSRTFPLWSGQTFLQIAILGFAALGLWRERRALEVTWLVAGVVLYILLVHWQVGFLTPRYLYPTMPLLLLLAGAGLAGFGERSAGSRAAP